MAFLKFIAIFFIIFYAVRFLLRLVMPVALRKVTERLMRNAQQSTAGGNAGQYQYTSGDPFSQFKQQAKPKHEGEVRVDYVPVEENKSRKGTETAGEFVDFEEVK